MSRSLLEVADIFRASGPAYRAQNSGHLSAGQLRVMSAIEACRTAELGGHVRRCEGCAHVDVAYNSCRKPAVLVRERVRKMIEAEAGVLAS